MTDQTRVFLTLFLGMSLGSIVVSQYDLNQWQFWMGAVIGSSLIYLIWRKSYLYHD